MSRHIAKSLVCLTTLGIIAASPAVTAGKPSEKPTIVLVHGAFAESASWNGVIAKLLNGGYSVVAVAASSISLTTSFGCDVITTCEAPLNKARRQPRAVVSPRDTADAPSGHPLDDPGGTQGGHP